MSAEFFAALLDIAAHAILRFLSLRHYVAEDFITLMPLMLPPSRLMLMASLCRRATPRRHDFALLPPP